MPAPSEPPPAATAPVVALDRVGMNYRGEVPALDDVTLSVGEGEFVSLVGPSGCGKSTLLRIVAGLVTPTTGDALVADRPAREARRRVRLSFVFQDATLLPWRTAERNVTLPLEIGGMPAGERRERARATLDMVGLAGFARRRPRELSGGMRMRVSLARALATEPRLMLLDEPFGALDDLTRQALNDELLRLWLERGWTALFVTHNLAEAAFLSTRIVVLSPRPGTIVADVPTPFDRQRDAELRATPEFARFVGQIAHCLRKEPS